VSTAAIQDAELRIAACTTCNRPLPLQKPLAGEASHKWTCSGCGSQFDAVLAPDYTLDELRNVRPEVIPLDLASLAPPADELVEFARKLAREEMGSVEKRAADRHVMIATVPACEMNEDLVAVGSPFVTTCRNISTGGMCLLNDRALLADFLMVQLTTPSGTPLQVLLHVLRRRPLGPYHDIGGELITRFAAADAS